jgi:branched-chain amino acid transport system substrate-binding protein
MLKLFYSVATLSALLIAGGSSMSVNADTLKIGTSLPMTGVQSTNGKEIHAHMVAAVKDLNAAGAFGRHKAEVQMIDDGYDPSRTKSNVTKLVNEGTHIIVNTVGAANLKAAIAGAEGSRVVIFGSVAGWNEAYSEKMRGRVVMLRASYQDEVKEQLGSIRAMGLTKVSIIYQDDSLGSDVLKGVDDALANFPDMRLLSKHPVVRNTDDVDGAVDTALSRSPDAIILALVSSPAKKALLRLQSERDKMGVGPYRVVFSMAATGENLAAAQSFTKGGVMFSSVTPNPTARTTKIALEYAKFRERHGLNQSFRGLEIWASMNALAQSVSKLSVVSAESVGSAVSGANGVTVFDHYFPLRGKRFVEVFYAGKNGIL